MTSEIRANTIKNRVGLGTVSFTNTGTVVSGIVTANTLRLPDSTSGSLGRVQLGNGLDLSLYHNGSNSFLVNNTGYLSIQSQDGVNGIFIARNAEVNLYYGPSVRLQTSSSGVTINRDLDVDGHTNLDNVSIAGITTMGQTTIFTTGGTTLLLKDSDSSNPADRSGIAFVDQNNTQTAFIGKESASDAVLTINNTNTINPIRLKVNNTTRLEVGNAGVYATGSLSATGTLSAGGTLYIPDDIQHSGDADTKIRFPSNDNISIETAGTSRIRIDGNGNIGINCTPASSGTLYDTVDHFLVIGDNDTGIAQDGDGQFEIWANQQEIINFSTVGIDPKKSILPNQAINIGQTSFPISHIYSTNITVGSQLIHQGDTDTFLEFGTNTISFDTAGSERLRISSGGQFTFNHDAVGTAYNFNGPSADNNWGGYLKLHSNNGTTVRAEIRASTSGMMFGYGGSERLRINSNGSVQVTPEGSTSNPYMLIDTSGDSVRFNAKKASGNNEFRFLTQSSGTVAERLRIDAYGRVLIGGTSAIIGSSSEFNEIVLTGKTRGAGITLQDVDANTRFQIRTDDNGDGTLLNASTNHPLVIRTNNTERFRIKSDGKVGINSTTPFGMFDVVTDFGLADNLYKVATVYRSGNNASGYTASGLQITSSADNNNGEKHTAYLSLSNRDPALNGSHGANSFITMTTPDSPGTYGTGQFDFYIRNGAPYTFPNDPQAASNYWMDSLFTIKSNSKIGINSTSPQAGLDVTHNDGAYIKSVTNGNGAKLRFSDNTGENYTQIGTIEYKHVNNQVVDGTAEGFLISGSEATTAVQIDGLLKVTAQPCAVVYQCTGPAGGAANASSDNLSPLHFDHVHINQGGMTISQDNGRIQVPVTGIYFVSFMVSGGVSNIDTNDGVELILMVNGSEYPSSNSGIEPVFNFGHGHTGSGSNTPLAAHSEFACNNTILVSLSKDDYVEVAFDNISGADANINRGNFCVMLMA